MFLYSTNQFNQRIVNEIHKAHVGLEIDSDQNESNPLIHNFIGISSLDFPILNRTHAFIYLLVGPP